MLDKDLVQRIVYRAIDRVNELLLEENSLPKRRGIVLIGDGSSLDSMGWVNFVVALEAELEAGTGIGLNLHEKFNTSLGGSSAICTVGQLIDFLSQQGTEPQPLADSSATGRNA